MCDPVTITVVALTVAAGVVQGYGQLQQGQAANAAAKHEAAIAERNVKLTEAARADAAKRGEREQLNHWRRISQLMGNQRAQFAANNLDVAFGTPAEVVENTMQLGLEDSLILAGNTIKEVKGFDIEAANYKESSVAARARGKAALAAGKIGAVGTLLSTAAQAAGSVANAGYGGKSSASYSGGGGSTSTLMPNSSGAGYGNPYGKTG